MTYIIGSISWNLELKAAGRGDGIADQLVRGGVQAGKLPGDER